MNTLPAFRFAQALCALAAALVCTSPALAEADATEAFPAFEKWIRVTVAPLPAPTAMRVEAVTMPVQGGGAAAPFEPQPVILGAPELPLLGDGAHQAPSRWGQGLNYQGLRVSLVTLDPRTGRASPQPVLVKVRPGQHFKLRLTSTFDGVAALDQVLGGPWDAQRTGQVYPAAGMSVEVKAGQTVDLPVGDGQYFVLRGRPADERLLLSVRHAKALGAARSTQAAYRSDGAQASHYLQLVPSGTHPAIEQLLNPGR